MAFRTDIDPAHVSAEVQRLVPPNDQHTVQKLLAGIRSTGWDVVWLQLAVLNLCGGRIDLLPQWIELANTDPRDLKMATAAHLDPSWDARFQWPAELPATKAR